MADSSTERPVTINIQKKKKQRHRFYRPPPPINRVGPVSGGNDDILVDENRNRYLFSGVEITALNTQRNRRRTANTTSNIMVFALSTESALLSSLAFEPESNHAEGSIIHAADFDCSYRLTDNFGQRRPSFDRRLAIAADKTPAPQRKHVQHRRVPSTKLSKNDKPTGVSKNAECAICSTQHPSQSLFALHSRSALTRRFD